MSLPLQGSAGWRAADQAYFIPGDICDQRIFVLRYMDHSISTVTPATVAVIPKESMITLTDRHPRIERALWWSTLVDEAITREWVMNVGQRDALQRLGHLICEMFVRLRAVGLVDGLSFSFPVIQAELADTGRHLAAVKPVHCAVVPTMLAQVRRN